MNSREQAEKNNLMLARRAAERILFLTREECDDYLAQLSGPAIGGGVVSFSISETKKGTTWLLTRKLTVGDEEIVATMTIEGGKSFH